MKPDMLISSIRMAESLGVAGSNTSTTNTLTPTTLRNITHIFESEECLQTFQKFEESGEFVPPVVTTSSATFGSNTRSKTYVTSNAWQGGTTTVVTPSKTIPLFGTFISKPDLEEEEEDDDSMGAPSPVSNSTRRSTRSAKTTTSRPSPYTAKSAKKQSGRKPANSRADEDLSPEEEHRLQTRRQRNKEAAARCRKRRVDQTTTLQQEVEQHEHKRQLLEEEIQTLKGEMEQLQFILQAHSAHCLLGSSDRKIVLAVKSEPVKVEAVAAQYEMPAMVQSVDEDMKPKRPATLSFQSVYPRVSEAGVDIETPSSHLSYLAFDTGFTPSAPLASIVTPVFTPTLNTPNNNCCSIQQRSAEMMGGDGMNGGSSPDFISL